MIEDMIRPIGIGAIGLCGMMLNSVVDPENAVSLERLGISAITIVILLYMLKSERDERMKMGNEYRALQDETRKENWRALAAHADAMAEHAKAQNHLAVVLDRRDPPK